MSVAATVTAIGFGSAVLGTAIVGAGVGGLYSAITKDGDILNSMLTGGLIGAGVGAMLPAAAGTAATAAGTTAAGATTPALAAQGAGGTMGGISAGGAFTPSASSAANFALPSLSTPASYGGYTALGEHVPASIDAAITGNTNAAGTFSSPTDIGAATQPSSNIAKTMTGSQKLAAGLAGTTALSLLGGRNQPTIKEQESESYIRPYTYSQKRNPNYGLPGESYFTQSYEAGEPYKAARGGIMRMADGGAAQPIVPMQQLAAPVNTYGAPQRPVAQAVTDYNQLLAQRAQNEYNVQPAPLSTLPGGGERAGAADTQKLINQYYLANLGRQGDQPGLDYFTNRKMTTGESLADINKAIQGSNEGQVFSAYKDLLGRRPDAGGSESYQKLLASGMSNEDLRKSIMGSQEYLSKNPEKTAYNAAPITAENFDEADYRSRYADAFQGPGRAYQHYLEANAAGDVRTANKRPFQQTSAPSGQSGYSYDPVTKRFTAPTSAAPAQESGGLTDITQDPGFQSFMQNQYRNYQQAQSGGGAAGGLMPGSLRYKNGGEAIDSDPEKLRMISAINQRLQESPENRDERNQLQFMMKNDPNFAASMSPPLQGMVEGAQYGDRMSKSYGGQPKDFNVMPTTFDPKAGSYGGIASIGKQIDPNTRINAMANLYRSPYDKNAAESVRRIGGGVSRQIGKDANLAAYYEQDPMGRNKAGGVRYSQSFNQGGDIQGYNLGGYSDGGRLLRGPGDGVSDDIPATIGNRQPARLADGEFVIPARIVSEIGNGSTDAGAKRLYAMMDRIQAGRKKTVGKGNVAKDTKAKKHLLA
jgi:hypothetical protein